MKTRLRELATEARANYDAGSRNLPTIELGTVYVQSVPCARRLGFVDLYVECSTVCLTAWVDGNLAELAGQLGKMVEHRNPSQANPSSTSTWDALYTTRVHESVEGSFRLLCLRFVSVTYVVAACACVQCLTVSQSVSQSVSQ